MNKKISLKGKSKNKNSKRSAVKKASHFTRDILLNSLSCPIFVYHHLRKQFVYVNNDFAKLINCSVKQCYNGGAQKFVSMIESNDNGMLRSIIKEKLFDKIHKLVDKKIFRLSYSVNYRFKVNGHYDHILQQVTAVEWDKSKNPVVTFNMLNNVSNRQKDHKIILSVNVFDEKEQQWKNVLTEEFLRRPSMLSERESEILYMMLKNMTAAEIAEKLAISYYTARAHLRNILRKTECKSRDELNRLASREGWG